MKQPIKAGDTCRIIDGVLKEKSPNVRKIVLVKSMQGNHSTLGVIWRVTGPELVSYNDMVLPDGGIDVPAIWLEKTDPESDAPEQLSKTVDLSVQ